MADVKMFTADNLDSLIDAVTKALSEKKAEPKKEVVKEKESDKISFDDVLSEATKLGEEFANEMIKAFSENKAEQKKTEPKKECVYPTKDTERMELERINKTLTSLQAQIDELGGVVDAIIEDINKLKDTTCSCACEDECDCCEECCDEECDCCVDDDYCDDPMYSYNDILEAVTDGFRYCNNMEMEEIFDDSYLTGYRTALHEFLRSF